MRAVEFTQKLFESKLSYIGNCTDDDVIEHLFGDATGFAQAVEEHGDDFELDDLVVKYDPDSDIHSFYYKQQGVAEDTLSEIYKMPPTKNSSQGMAVWAYNDALAKKSPVIYKDNNVIIYKANEELLRYIILQDGNPVLYIGLAKFLDGYKSGTVATEIAGRGKGLAQKAYINASDILGVPIYSDTTQTDASRLGIWDKLIQQYPNRIVGYDQKTNKNLPLSSTDKGPVVNQNQPIYVDRNKKDTNKPISPNQRYRTRILKLLPSKKQGVTEDKSTKKISFKLTKGRNKFSTTMMLDGVEAGVYQYDANSGRSIAEVFPEFKGQGFGKILVLNAIYTAAKLGMDFIEDESRTAEYDNVLDSLSENGYIVSDDEYWYVTGEGEQFLKQSLRQGVTEDAVNLPSVLYHATYKPRLKSIKLKGLGGGGKRNWEDSKPGVVYLALDPNVAESYAETSDIVPEEWLDNIVILKISTAGLDPNKFHIDSNVQDNAGDTIEYHGVIPVSNISMYKQGVTEDFDKEAGAWKEWQLKMLPRKMEMLSRLVKGWTPSEEDHIAAIEAGYVAMRDTGDVKDAAKAISDTFKEIQSRQGVMGRSLTEVLNTKPSKKTKAYWEHDDELGSTLHFQSSNGLTYELSIIPIFYGPDEAHPWEFADMTTEQDERGVYVEFAQIEDKRDWSKDKKNITGAGSSAEVFGIVSNGILQYVKKFRPSFLMMQAAEMNRRRLYSAMLSRLLPLVPGYKSIGPKADGMYFIYDSKQISVDHQNEQGVNEVTVDEMALSTYKTMGDFTKPGPFTGADKKLVPHPKNIEKATRFFEQTPFDFRLFFSHLKGTGKYSEHGPMSHDQIRQVFGQDAEEIINGSEDAITVVYVGNKGDAKVMLTPWMMAHRFGHAINAGTRNKNWTAWGEAEKYFFQTVNALLEEHYGKSKSQWQIRPTSEFNRNLTPEYNALFNAMGTQRSSATGQIRRPYEFLYELFAQYLGTGKVTLNPLPTNLTYGRKVFGNPTKYMNIKPEYRDEGERKQAADSLAYTMELLFSDVLSDSVGKIFVM